MHSCMYVCLYVCTIAYSKRIRSSLGFMSRARSRLARAVTRSDKVSSCILPRRLRQSAAAEVIDAEGWIHIAGIFIALSTYAYGHGRNHICKDLYIYIYIYATSVRIMYVNMDISASVNIDYLFTASFRRLILQHGLLESLQGHGGLPLLHQYICPSEGKVQVVLQPAKSAYM